MNAVCVSVCLFFSVFFTFAQTHAPSVFHARGSAPGYVLFSPLESKITYLIDKCGNTVHSWSSNYKPAQSVYLLPDGSLFRAGNDTTPCAIACVGGKIERYDWNNNLLWSFSISNDRERQHHDICALPNGNVLAIVYVKKSREEVISAGRSTIKDLTCLLDEKIVEIKPIGRDSGAIVWQWDVWDHLVQDKDPKASHYGNVVQNPQLFNINFTPSTSKDWLHFNSISYNARLDQIMVSIHEFSEIFIIDHSTTTAQAASHKGGKRGKGGDLLYRWGNPATYDAGSSESQILFGQHNAHWIGEGLKDEGKIMIFNNGLGRSHGRYSTVEIIEPPVDKNGNYVLEPGKMAMPLAPSWIFAARQPGAFFSPNISGAQRLENGNTLICSGANGTFFEIDRDKNIVWKFINPAGEYGRNVFRCTFYEQSFKAFEGKNLSPCSITQISPRTEH